MRYLLLSLIFTISLAHSSNAAPGDTYLCEVTQWFENRPTQYKEFAKDIFELQKHDPVGKVFLFKWTEDNFLNFIDKGSREEFFKHFVDIRLNDKIIITPSKHFKDNFTAYHTDDYLNSNVSFAFEGSTFQYVVMISGHKDIVNANCHTI